MDLILLSMFSTEVYKERRKGLRARMNGGIILLFGNLEAPMNYFSNTYRFRQDSSFLYYFGISQPGLAGVLDVESGEDYLFGNDLTIEDIVWMGYQPTLQDLGRKVGVSHTLPFDKLEDFVERSKDKGKRIHYLPPYRCDRKIQIEGVHGMPCAQVYKYASKDLIKAVVDMRSSKDAFEIAEMENTLSTATYDMHLAVMNMAKPGVLEQTIAGYIEGIALSHGGTVSYPVILSKHGEILHNHSHNNILKAGDLVLTDAAAESSEGYATDITRTVPVGGKFSTKQREIYDLVLKAEEEVINNIYPGSPYKDLHNKASYILAEGLKTLGLLKGDINDIVENGAHALFFPHGIGHMLGLDVHDMEDLGEEYVGYDEETTRSEQFGTSALRIARKLRPGFVVTVEPGIYFIPPLIELWKKEKKFEAYINYKKVEDYLDFGGIRIEDNVLVTEKGSKVLGKPIPKKAEDIEAIMQ
jgi:Xaa-Pro aminopeptidase